VRKNKPVTACLGCLGDARAIPSFFGFTSSVHVVEGLLDDKCISNMSSEGPFTHATLSALVAPHKVLSSAVPTRRAAAPSATAQKSTGSGSEAEMLFRSWSTTRATTPVFRSNASPFVDSWQLSGPGVSTGARSKNRRRSDVPTVGRPARKAHSLSPGKSRSRLKSAANVLAPPVKLARDQSDSIVGTNSGSAVAASAAGAGAACDLVIPSASTIVSTVAALSTPAVASTRHLADAHVTRQLSQEIATAGSTRLCLPFLFSSSPYQVNSVV